MESTNMAIGQRIKALRKQRGMTQAELGVIAGCTSKHISEIERGVTGISIDLQLVLSAALRCSVDYLLTGKNYNPLIFSLPDGILEILLSDDDHEITLLNEYLRLYLRLRNKSN